MGYFFRTDKENSQKITLPETNNDISLQGDANTPVYKFIDGISKFETVHTDRLHVSILASLMGKDVHLYPGSYFKSRAIYLLSMKNHFKNIHFHESTEFIEAKV